MNSISMLDLKPYFEKLSPNELVLDVRTDQEFAEGHVPNARHLPFELVINHADELKKYEQVYVYCRSGRRSHTACVMLESQGLKNLTCVDEGGMPDWEEAGFPVE